MTQAIFIQTLIYTSLSLFLLVYSVRMAFHIKSKTRVVAFALGEGSVILWLVFSLSHQLASIPIHVWVCSTGEIVALLGAIIGSLYTGIREKQLKWFGISFVFLSLFFIQNAVLSFSVICLGAFLWVAFEAKETSAVEERYAVERLMDVLEDEVIVLDRNETIMAVSGTLKKRAKTQRIPETYSELLTFMNWHVDEKCGLNEGIIELDGEPYRVMILRKELENDKNERIGEVIICHDITEYYKLREKRDEESRKLAQVHRELVDYITVQNELATEETKRKFAEKIQSSIGVALDDLIERLEQIQKIQLGDEDGTIQVAEVEMMVESGRKIIRDIRGTATVLMGDEKSIKEGARLNHDQNNCCR